MKNNSTLAGRIALMVAHCAGMVDLVALPVWVGTLVTSYHLAPQQAGLLATLYLAAAVVASLWVAPRFARLPGRWVVNLGFGGATVAFGGLMVTTQFEVMAVLHAVAGLCAGAALSVTHGTIARSSTPHRLFALVGMALGVFGVVFLAGTPQLVAHLGGPALFGAFASVMALATLTSSQAFPEPEINASSLPVARGQALKTPISAAVWAGMFGLGSMSLAQAMTFSFLERVGDHRGFGMEAVNGVLVALGLVNLLPAALAAVLEKRLPARLVVLIGPVVQAGLALTIMTSTEFRPYAIAASVFAAVMIFTHTFAFGALARLDRTGRALAATPAMLMIGAALGPIVGGGLVQSFGYSSLGWAAVAIDSLALLCFLRLSLAQAEPTSTSAASSSSAPATP